MSEMTPEAVIEKIHALMDATAHVRREMADAVRALLAERDALKQRAEDAELKLAEKTQKVLQLGREKDILRGDLDNRKQAYAGLIEVRNQLQAKVHELEQRCEAKQAQIDRLQSPDQPDAFVACLATLANKADEVGGE